MRTKTLLLSALLGAGAASASAQNVYSVNAVGYVNVGFPVGFSIRANPLNATPNNALGTIFDSAVVPDGTKVFRYTPGSGFLAFTFGEQDPPFTSPGWGAPETTILNPGEAFFVKTSVAFTNTFVGEVPQGAASNQQVPLGFSLKASVVPQAGQLDTVLGYAPDDGDKIYKLQPSGQYVTSTWVENDPPTVPPTFSWFNVPTFNVAEGFWIQSKTAKTWTRNFSVNQ